MHHRLVKCCFVACLTQTLSLLLLIRRNSRSFLWNRIEVLRSIRSNTKGGENSCPSLLRLQQDLKNLMFTRGVSIFVFVAVFYRSIKDMKMNAIIMGYFHSISYFPLSQLNLIFSAVDVLLSLKMNWNWRQEFCLPPNLRVYRKRWFLKWKFLR